MGDEKLNGLYEWVKLLSIKEELKNIEYNSEEQIYFNGNFLSELHQNLVGYIWNKYSVRKINE